MIIYLLVKMNKQPYDLLQTRTDPVKPKILELIQVWSNAFRNEPSYKVVQDTYHLMKMEGKLMLLLVP